MVLNRENATDFEYELMQWILDGEYSCRYDYCNKKGTTVRIKGHDANWSNFMEDAEHGIKSFMSITVGDYNNRLNDEKMTIDEFTEFYEDVVACEFTIEDGMTLDEAKDFILYNANLSNITLF